MRLYNSKNDYISGHDGYAPKFMSGECGGDYIRLKIDTDTGKILDWKPPAKAQLEYYFGEFEDSAVESKK